MRRRLLFVVGCPRSGTTDFVRLINCHEKVLVGCERFLHWYSGFEDWSTAPDWNFLLNSFDTERFVNVQEGDTYFRHITDMVGWQKYGTTEPLRKFNQAAVVGDKAPIGIFYVGELFTIFPNSIFVTMFRENTSVCRSWDRRAADTDDVLWKREDDFEIGVRSWLDALEAAIRYKKMGYPIIDVFAPALYHRQAGVLERVFSCLGLDLDKGICDQYDAIYDNGLVDRKPEIPEEPEKEVIFRNFGRIYNIVSEFSSVNLSFGLEEAFWPGFIDEFHFQDDLYYKREQAALAASKGNQGG